MPPRSRAALLLPLLAITGCVGGLRPGREGGTAAAHVRALRPAAHGGVLTTALLRGAVLREEGEDAPAARRPARPRGLAVTIRRDGSRPCRGHAECAAGHYCPAATQVCKECRFCTSNGEAVDGRCPLECASATAAAGGARGPPALGWAFVDNRADEVGNTVRLTQPGEMVWVDFYMYVKDMGYGISSATLFFTSSTLSGEVFGIKAVASASRSMVSTTSEGGVLKASFWFEYADEAGRWGLRQLQLEDNAGNMRVYSDMDLLLFGSSVNGTIEVVGSADRYVTCAEATQLRCHSKAVCFDQCHSPDSAGSGCFGKCSCNPGHAGNEFTCIKTELLEEYRANGTEPTGLVILADEWPEGTGGSSTISHEELAGRDPAADPQASSASTSSASSGSSSRGQLEPEESRGCMSTMYCSSALFVVLFLAVSGAALVLMRGRIVFMGTIYAVLAHRRRQRHRVAPGLDEENPRSLSRRLQAWSHDSEERTANANGRMRRNQRDLEAEFEAQLIAWTEALSASEARPRPGGSGGGRAMYIRPSQPPQEPAPVSLPAHLQRAKMPGEVVEEVAEGQECAVCMERRQDTKLVPCGHTDLCHGCAEHIHNHGGQCPVCRAKITSVRRIS